MKGSDAHRRAFDALQAAIASALEAGNRVKKTLNRYVQWLQNCRRLVRRLTSNANAGMGTDPHLHAQIRGAQNEAFHFIAQACNGMDALLENVWIKHAQLVIDAAPKKLDEHSLRLRGGAQALSSLYETFASEIAHGGDVTTTRPALETGFTHHCVYVRYEHELGELEVRLEQAMVDLAKTVSDLNHFLDKSTTQVNQLFVKRFRKILGSDMAEKFAMDNVEALATTRAVIKGSLSTFKQPSFTAVSLCQFQDVKMKMVVKAAYDASDDKGATVQTDEIVEVIDTRGHDYWVVRKGDGTEGYVPARILWPHTAGAGSQRTLSAAGASTPPMGIAVGRSNSLPPLNPLASGPA
jgi:hypothetical protein